MTTTLPYRILSALERGGMSIAELYPVVHASRDAVDRHIRHLIVQRLVHLSQYRRSKRGPFTAVYSLGPGDGQTPEKPQTLNAAQKCARWRASGGDQHKSYRLKRDAKRIAKCMTMAGMLGVQPSKATNDHSICL